MKVLLIGKTEADLFPYQGSSRHVMPGKAGGSEFQRRVQRDAGDDPFDPGGNTGQELIEFAGRLCYESWDLPNPVTANNPDYVGNLVAQGHESVLEHVSVTFYVEGVSRNMTHELIRHRHLSFSELSQRFVNMENAYLITPPLWKNLSDEYREVNKQPLNVDVVETYKHNVKTAHEAGATRKQAREAARATIPGGVETKLVVSGNLRAWRDVIKKRWTAAADMEMQQFAAQVQGILFEEYPDVFADLAYGA